MVPWQLDWLGSLMTERTSGCLGLFLGGFAGGSLVHAERTAERADLTDRRRLPDRAAAHSGTFLPGAELEILGDRSIIDWDGSSDETYYRLHEDPDGMGIEIEWLGSRVAFQSGNPMPLLRRSAGWSR